MSRGAKVRVAFVSTSTTIGGAEKTLYTLATSIDPGRFEVAGVVSLKPKGHYARLLERQGIPVESFDSQRAGMNSFHRLGDLIDAWKPGVVHAIMFQAMQLCRAVKKFGSRNFPLLTSPRVHYRSRSLPTLLLDRFLNSADNLLVAESMAHRDFLCETLGYDPERTETIYNGIQPGASSIEARRRVRETLKIAPDVFTVLSAGRLERQKGHAHLLEAVALINVVKPLRAIIVGDGILRGPLEKLARRLKIEDKVRFVGEQAPLTDWLSAADAFVLPSLWEGLPNVLLEAMGQGVPVVATSVDGVPEVVEEGRSGLLCDPGNPLSLAEGIQTLIQDPALAARLAKAGQARVKERFRLPEMIAAYEAAYERIARAA